MVFETLSDCAACRSGVDPTSPVQQHYPQSPTSSSIHTISCFPTPFSLPLLSFIPFTTISHHGYHTLTTLLKRLPYTVHKFSDLLSLTALNIAHHTFTQRCPDYFQVSLNAPIIWEIRVSRDSFAFTRDIGERWKGVVFKLCVGVGWGSRMC
jgi:hypothetical protein